jgi:hypothetical protein
LYTHIKRGTFCLNSKHFKRIDGKADSLCFTLSVFIFSCLCMLKEVHHVKISNHFKKINGKEKMIT